MADAAYRRGWFCVDIHSGCTPALAVLALLYLASAIITCDSTVTTDNHTVLQMLQWRNNTANIHGHVWYIHTYGWIFVWIEAQYQSLCEPFFINSKAEFKGYSLHMSNMHVRTYDMDLHLVTRTKCLTEYSGNLCGFSKQCTVFCTKCSV